MCLRDVNRRWCEVSEKIRYPGQVRLCRERKHYSCESAVVESDAWLICFGMQEWKHVKISLSQAAESIEALSLCCKIVVIRVDKRLSRSGLANYCSKLVVGKVGLRLSEKC
jgi:hypothetical protein